MKYSLFVWRFRCRRRPAFLSSLLNSSKFLMFKVKCYCFVRTCPIIFQNLNVYKQSKPSTTSENFFPGLISIAVKTKNCNAQRTKCCQFLPWKGGTRHEPKDDQMKLTLWGDDIKAVNPGDIVVITNGYTNEFKGEVSLTKGKFGQMEVNPQ